MSNCIQPCVHLTLSKHVFPLTIYKRQNQSELHAIYFLKKGKSELCNFQQSRLWSKIVEFCLKLLAYACATFTLLNLNNLIK